MSRFAVDFQRTLNTAQTVGSLTADATRPRRMVVYQALFGSEASPADQALLWRIARVTAAGTSTGVTPTMLDDADPLTEQDAGENHSAEPTYTAGKILLHLPLNQKATALWQTLPENGLVTPATAAYGVGVMTPTVTNAATPVVTCTLHAQEI